MRPGAGLGGGRRGGGWRRRGRDGRFRLGAPPAVATTGADRSMCALGAGGGVVSVFSPRVAMCCGRPLDDDRLLDRRRRCFLDRRSSTTGSGSSATGSGSATGAATAWRP